MGETGKFRKAAKVSLARLEKVIPLVLVPDTYLMTCLAALMCCGDGFTWCCASKDTAVARSGLVA